MKTEKDYRIITNGKVYIVEKKCWWWWDYEQGVYDSIEKAKDEIERRTAKWTVVNTPLQ